MLVNRLQKAIQLQKRNQVISQLHLPIEPSCCLSLAQLLSCEHLRSAIPREIPLNRVKDKTQICYVSAIALKLTGRHSRKGSPVNLALEIGDCLEQMMALKNDGFHSLDDHPLARVWQNVTVRVEASGWIYLKLTEQGVAEWLQILVDRQTNPSNLAQSTSRVAKNTSSLPKNALKVCDSTDKFHILYGHARCCSILRSAVKEGIVSQNLLDFELKESSSSLFKPQHPAEKNLISQIATALDAAYLDRVTNPVSIWKSAQALSYSFEEFDKSCRIWGEVMQCDPQLARMRLGLVVITQKILRSLLASLEIEAPFEL